MGRAIDMTGWVMKEHGVSNSKLTVLYELPERENKRIVWHCRCECGNECNVNSSKLRKGQIISCGCIQKEKVKVAPGSCFGYLTVIEKTNKYTNSGKAIWKCQCRCGNICEVYTSALTSGNTQSCGCLYKQVLKKPKTNIPIGSKYGLLTVIKLLDEQNSDGKYYYLCKCDCGNFKKVIGYHLENYNVSSCGCKKLFKGEILISKILKENHFSFEQQKTFNDCKFEDTKYPAYFDFYIDNKYIIEYDGSQHFETKESGWNTQEALIKTQEHDNFKNQYCFKHNIPIIRIPYTHLKNICLEDLIPETSKFLLKQEE